MGVLTWLGGLAVALPLALLGAGQAGWLAGQAPADLGVHGGRLKAPSPTANSVSSQAALWPRHPQAVAADIAPLPLQGDAAATLARLRAVVEAIPGAHVVDSRPDYLSVQFTTRWLKFVDDAEFWVDPQGQVVQVRSASRLGESDLGVNRQRIEQIRATLTQR
jgi:uncharacterized protein (DUF1499 family)